MKEREGASGPDKAVRRGPKIKKAAEERPLDHEGKPPSGLNAFILATEPASEPPAAELR
jgi:hypothetical protein